MAVTSSRYIATFRKKFYRPSMAVSRAILILQSGENKLFVIITISYAWNHMAQVKLIERSQKRTTILNKVKEIHYFVLINNIFLIL